MCERWLPFVQTWAANIAGSPQSLDPDCQDTCVYIFDFGTIYINGDLDKTSSA